MKTSTKYICGIGFVVLVVIVVLLLVFGLPRLIGKPAEPEAVTIAAVLDLTGPPAVYGKWTQQGMELAADELNAEAYGDYTWELVFEDSQSDVKTGVSAFTKLASEPTIQTIVVGPNSSTVLGCAPIANETERVLLAPASSSPNITEAGSYIFRNRLSGSQEMIKLAEYLIGVGVMEVGFAAMNNDMGIAYEDTFREDFAESGGTVVETVYLDLGVTDFRTEASKIKEIGVGAVVLAGPAKESAYFIKQSFELGYDPAWYSTTPVENEELLTIAGAAAEGLVYIAEAADLEYPKYQEFADAFRAKFGEEPNIYCVNGYDAAKIIAYGIVEGGKTGPEIQAILATLKDFEGAGGLLSFDENGDIEKQVLMKEVRDGKFVIKED